MTEFDNKYHLSQLTNYSLGETCIGKWIDGREIWRKVISWPEMAFYEAHGIANLKDVINISCITEVFNQNYRFTVPSKIKVEKSFIHVDVDYVEYQFKNTIIIEYTVN